MPAVHTIVILFLALAAGCAAIKEEAPPSVMAQTGSLIVDPSLVRPNQDGAVASEPPGSEAKEEATVTLAPPPAGPREPVMTGDKAKVSASPMAIEQPRKNGDPLPVAKTLEPPLDVAALKARLRDTTAIGVFTKLALKNQMDDLLNQFRAYYQGGQKTSVASLRQPYDMLVLKVLSLVQDSDPSLARTISGSREAIWAILANAEKFKAAT